MAEIKEVIKEVVKYNRNPKTKEYEPLTSFKLVIDSPTNSLEHNYYWILDFIDAKDVDKIKDTFTSSVGSGHFSEMGGKTSKMQEEGMKMLGAINQVIKSIIQLIYDLKEFEMRLDHYKKAKSEKKEEKEAGLLALKQIWLDQVDMKRGRGSIHQMTYEMGYTTLRDAFMICNTIEDVDKNEIVNEQVKRILKPRVAEFLAWKDLSEKELTSRFNIQKTYLKSQVQTLKLYSSWARPYLKAAEDLRMKGFDKNPAIINAFSTAMFDLIILKKREIKLGSLVEEKKVPITFLNYKDNVRKYYGCNVISFLFRGVPQRNQRGDWDVVGRIEITFDAYAINNKELDIIKKQLRKDELSDVLNSSILQEQADVSLKELKADIDHFLASDEEKKAEEEKRKKEEGGKDENINPFSALFNLFFTKVEKKEEKKEEKKDEEKTEEELKKEIAKLTKELKADSFVEKSLRAAAVESARGSLYAVYDIYKKAHGMGSTPENFDFQDEPAVPSKPKFSDIWKS